MKAVWAVGALFLLAGCASDEKPESKGPPAQVTVYRVPSVSDSVFPMLFAVDGRPLGQLYPGDERTFEVAAGDYKLEYVLDVYNCAADVRVESGEIYVYRLTRGCRIDRVSDRGQPAAAERSEPDAGIATTWAAEMEAREESERDPEDDRSATW